MKRRGISFNITDKVKTYTPDFGTQDYLKITAINANCNTNGLQLLASTSEESSVIAQIGSEKNIKTCTITKEVVENHATPKLTYYKKTA